MATREQKQTSTRTYSLHSLLFAIACVAICIGLARYLSRCAITTDTVRQIKVGMTTTAVREIAGEPASKGEYPDGRIDWCYSVWNERDFGTYSDPFAVTFDRENGVVIDRNY